MNDRPVRIVLAKLGLDDHQRAMQVLSYAFRDAGMEVVYLGPYQTPEHVTSTAQVEDADAIGLSFHTVSYFGWIEETIQLLRDQGVWERIRVFVGGTIPPEDKAMLEDMGVAGVFFPGDSLKDMTDHIKASVFAMRERLAATKGSGATSSAAAER